MIRIKRHRWNKNGEKETHLLYKTEEQYGWLKPSDFIQPDKSFGNNWFEKYPYQWYEINYLWNVPLEYIIYFLKKYMSIDLSNFTITKAIMKIVIFLIEIVSVWYATRILDSIF